MRRKAAALALALLLLAGCAPTPKGDRAELDAFVAQVDAARAAKAVWTQEEKARFEAYTPDISDQADALTQAELEALIEPHKKTYLSKEQVLADIDLFFRLIWSRVHCRQWSSGRSSSIKWRRMARPTGSFRALS